MSTASSSPAASSSHPLVVESTTSWKPTHDHQARASSSSGDGRKKQTPPPMRYYHLGTVRSTPPPRDYETSLRPSANSISSISAGYDAQRQERLSPHHQKVYKNTTSRPRTAQSIQSHHHQHYNSSTSTAKSQADDDDENNKKKSGEDDVDDGHFHISYRPYSDFDFYEESDDVLKKKVASQAYGLPPPSPIFIGDEDRNNHFVSSQSGGGMDVTGHFLSRPSHHFPKPGAPPVHHSVTYKKFLAVVCQRLDEQRADMQTAHDHLDLTVTPHHEGGGEEEDGSSNVVPLFAAGRSPLPSSHSRASSQGQYGPKSSSQVNSRRRYSSSSSSPLLSKKNTTPYRPSSSSSLPSSSAVQCIGGVEEANRALPPRPHTSLSTSSSLWLKRITPLQKKKRKPEIECPTSLTLVVGGKNNSSSNNNSIRAASVQTQRRPNTASGGTPSSSIYRRNTNKSNDSWSSYISLENARRRGTSPMPTCSSSTVRTSEEVVRCSSASADTKAVRSFQKWLHVEEELRRITRHSHANQVYVGGGGGGGTGV